MNAIDRYDSLIQYWWSQSVIDWKLGKAQMIAESNANPLAVSHVGAKGLYQFMDATWQDWKPGTNASVWEPEASIRAGARYLASLRAHYQGEINKALAAYNWGCGNLDKHLATLTPDDDWLAGCPLETRVYVERINALWRAASPSGPSPQGVTT